MAIVEHLGSVNHYNLMGTFFLSFLSLISVECITGEFSSNETEATSNENREVPIIIEGPSNQYASVGGSTFFKCVTYNANSNNVTWLHDGKIIEPNSNLIKIGRYLLIREVDENLFGNYTCLVNSPRGTDSSSAFLYSEEPWKNDRDDPNPSDDDNHSSAPIKWVFMPVTKPNSSMNSVTNRLHLTFPAGGIRHERAHIKEEHPKDIVTAAVGAVASFSCPHASNPDVYTRWIKSTCAEIENLYNSVPEQCPLVLSLDEVHTIENVAKEDDGWYSCVTSSGLGNELCCKSVYLKVVNDNEEVTVFEWAVLAVGIPIVGASIILFIILYRRMKEKGRELLALEAAIDHLRYRGLNKLPSKSNDYV